jgi:hypothetical protein
MVPMLQVHPTRNAIQIILSLGSTLASIKLAHKQEMNQRGPYSLLHVTEHKCAVCRVPGRHYLVIVSSKSEAILVTGRGGL